MRFFRRREEPMLIEDGVAYYPNRSARRALKEAQMWERGEIEHEEYVPLSDRKSRNEKESE